jgi:hypothetical protein
MLSSRQDHTCQPRTACTCRRSVPSSQRCKHRPSFLFVSMSLTGNLYTLIHLVLPQRSNTCLLNSHCSRDLGMVCICQPHIVYMFLHLLRNNPGCKYNYPMKYTSHTILPSLTDNHYIGKFVEHYTYSDHNLNTCLWFFWVQEQDNHPLHSMCYNSRYISNYILVRYDTVYQRQDSEDLCNNNIYQVFRHLYLRTQSTACQSYPYNLLVEYIVQPHTGSRSLDTSCLPIA